MRTIEEVIAELRNDIHSDVYLGKKTINTYLDEILEIHKAERPQGEGKCVTCKYRACWVTENPCRECSHSYANLYEEEENDSSLS